MPIPGEPLDTGGRQVRVGTEDLKGHPHLMSKAPAIARRPFRRGSTPARDPSLSRLFARFALTGLLAMLLIGAVGFVLVRHSATASAIRQAKGLTALAGRGIVEPLLTPQLLAGDRKALTRLDRAVHHRILRDTPIVRVKVWDARGRIVYSDARRHGPGRQPGRRRLR